MQQRLVNSDSFAVEIDDCHVKSSHTRDILYHDLNPYCETQVMRTFEKQNN